MSHAKTNNQSKAENHVDEQRDEDLSPILPEEAMSHVEEDAAEAVEESIELSAEAAELVRQLEAERDEASAARVRALADMANLEKRARREQQRALQEGTSRVVSSLLPALDNFELALDQDPAKMTAEQYVAGIRLVHGELLKALESHDVQRIEPRAGEPFDPERHEAMYRERAKGAAPNTIVTCLQPGYAIGDMVLRPAKVAISE